MAKVRKPMVRLLLSILAACLILYLGVFFAADVRAARKTAFMLDWGSSYSNHLSADSFIRSEEFGEKLSKAALKRTKANVRYDGSYFRISYPGGDVPANVGVCTDVLIRSYRALGIDLQKEVHEDMKANFDDYPSLWGLKSPDTNIDHRRVPNLMVFLSRKGVVLPITDDSKDYLPGDIVAWNYYGLTHIGIVSNKMAKYAKRYMIVHNIGAGPKFEDFLFEAEIIGHFRYEG